MRTVLRALLERWKWWVIPMLVMLVLTLLLMYFGQGTTVEPIQYDVPGP